MPFSDLKSIKILSEIAIEIDNGEVNSMLKILTIGTAPNFAQPLLVTPSR